MKTSAREELARAEKLLETLEKSPVTAKVREAEAHGARQGEIDALVEKLAALDGESQGAPPLTIDRVLLL